FSVSFSESSHRTALHDALPILNGNNGQPISGLSDAYKNFVGGTMFKIGTTSVPWYVLYAVVLTAIMWFVWNKTTFGKNMFAVGSDRKSTRLNSSHVSISYAVFC